MTELVASVVRDGLSHLELNRPHISNAIDLQTAEALGAAVEEAENNRDVRAILITGAGDRFCAGGDVASFLDATDPADYLYRLASTLDLVLQRLTATPKPVVVAVHGAVAGAGLSLMLSGDLIIAGESTKFVAAYQRVGLTPDCGLSWLLPRTVGHVRAADMLLTDRVLTATEALSWGLVTRSVADETVFAQARLTAERIATGHASALGQTKLLLRDAWTRGRADAGSAESRSIAAALATFEAKAAIERFLGP